MILFYDRMKWPQVSFKQEKSPYNLRMGLIVNFWTCSELSPLTTGQMLFTFEVLSRNRSAEIKPSILVFEFKTKVKSLEHNGYGCFIC